MVHHEGDELLYVLEGEISQTVDGDTIRLSAGDSLHFRGSSDHSWANESDRPARILWTGTMSILRPRQEGERQAGVDRTKGVVTALNHSTSAGRTRT